LSGRPWRLVEADQALGLAISQRLALPDIVGRVLAGRRLDLAAAETFLAPRLRTFLPDPSHLHDLDRAVERLVRAVRDGETVGLIGDYDVDGATATALMVRYLRCVGCPTVVEIPDRFADGYGPNAGAFARLAGAGCRLVLTLDAGTTAHEPLGFAREQGLEVIVVDHHSGEVELPPAVAVVNPNRVDQTSPLGDLAAVGVAFVLLVGLNRALREAGLVRGGDEPELRQWLDLVALGTVADVVPLQGLNRAFVHQGLKVAATTANPGLRALAAAAGVERITRAQEFGFALGPRINAGGRLGESPIGAKLLATEDEDEARRLAARLNELNARRQRLEQTYLEAAERDLQAQLDLDRPVLVASGEGWHVGVIGIVASRLVERFGRPVFVIGVEDGQGKGSGRSIPGFDMGRAVIAARQAGLLEAGGGHPMAAGLTIAADRLDAFSKHLEAAFVEASGSAAPPVRPLDIEAELSPGALNPGLPRKLACLEPFGAGNAEPVVALAEARIVQPRIVGNGHISCYLADATGIRGRAIAFRAQGGPLEARLMAGDTVLRLAGRLRLDSYGGQDRCVLHITDAAAPN